MQLSLQLSKLQGTTSYFDGNMGRVGVKSDTVGQGCYFQPNPSVISQMSASHECTDTVFMT